MGTLDPLDFVRTIAVARICMPASVVRLSAGREDMSEETQALCFLVDLVGAEHVFLGTDAPFDMGDEVPLKTIADAPGLSMAQQTQVTGRTALSLLQE